MRAKIEYGGHVDFRNQSGYLGGSNTAKITINGKSRKKFVSSDICNFMMNRDKGFEISDKPLPGFRKLYLQNVGSIFHVKCNNIANWTSYVSICKRGLRDIGFKNNKYIYVKIVKG